MTKTILGVTVALGAIALVVTAILLSPLAYNGTSDIKIMDHRRFSTLNEILEQDCLQNTTLVVDMWGTYCGPCIKEFDFATELKERYKEKPVTFLYLCTINRIDHKVRWKKIIEEKQLTGYHIAIDSDELFSNIWEQHLSEPSADKYLIPRYFIVKNGTILVQDAASPSSKEKLYSQIDSILTLN